MAQRAKQNSQKIRLVCVHILYLKIYKFILLNFVKNLLNL